MADSTTNLTQIEAAQAAKEVTANGLFDSASPATFGGRRAEACSGLTWGYYGGRWGGTSVPNGTITLGASTTTYVVAAISNGAITSSTSTTNWNASATYVRLYKIVSGVSSVTSYEDHRAGPNGSSGGGAGAGATFTQALNETAPNTTTPVGSLTATNASYSNIDVAVVGKGSGAFTRQVADSTAVGGNKRGSYAVDLQSRRDNATEVASGQDSIILGGYRNTASATSACVGGNASTATATYAFAYGDSADATASGAVAMGVGVTASGPYSVAFGQNSTASGEHSVAMGYAATTRGISGSRAFAGAANVLVSNGDCQMRDFVLGGRTTDATPKVLTTDNSAAGTNDQIVLASGASLCFTGIVHARRDTGASTSSWKIEGQIKNVGGTMTLEGSAVTAISNAAGWTLALSADSTNKALAITATGAAATTIKWAAYVQVVESFG